MIGGGKPVAALKCSRPVKTVLRVLTVLLAAGTGFRVSADGAVQKYTLEDCIRVGLEKNAGAANARRDKEIAASRITQARSTAMPHLNLSASYTRLDELQTIEFGEEELELGTLDNYSANLGLTQLLYSGGKVGAALRAAGLARSQADWACAEVEGVLVRDIKLAFYDLLYAKAAADVRGESLRQLGSLLDQTETRKKNGAASEFDVLRASVRVANEKPQLIKAENTLEVCRERLSRLLNVDEAAVDIEGTLELAEVKPDLEKFQRLALVQRPAVRAMESVLDLYREGVVSARSEALPSLSAQFMYNGANSYEFVSYEDQWQWHWNAGLVLRWNLWDGGLTRGTVRESRLAVENALASLDELRKSVKLEVKRYCLDIEYAREAAAAGEETIAQARKAMEIAEARHKQGLGTYLEFSDANLALSTAHLTWLQAVHAHMSAVANLEFASGAGKVAVQGRAEGGRNE